MEKAEQKVDESRKKWLSNVHACGHGKLSFRRSPVTDGFLLFGSHDLRDRSRTNDSRTRVHRLTNRFNSTFRPTRRTFGSRSYIIVEQKVLFVRRVAQETEQNYRIQGHGRDGARSIDSSIFLERTEGSSSSSVLRYSRATTATIITSSSKREPALLRNDSNVCSRTISLFFLRPRFSFWQDSWQKPFFGARSNFTGVA